MLELDRRRGNNLGYWAYSASVRFPDQPVILDWADGRQRTLTHAQLEARLDIVASTLSKSVGVGERIAIGIGNRAEFVEACFGAMRAGLVTVPLNLRQGRTRIAHTLKDSGCVAAIVELSTNAHLQELIEDSGIGLRVAVGQVPPGWHDYTQFFNDSAAPFEPPLLQSKHPAMQPYTSGSTGTPKGVVLTHEGQMWWINTYLSLYNPTPEERSLVAVPLYHKNAMAGVVKAKLPGGACMVLMPEYNPRQFLINLSQFRCTHATGVPTIYTLAMRETDLMETLDFSALRSLTVGSAPVHYKVRRGMEQSFKCPVTESYGLTEGGPVMFGPPTDNRRVPSGSCGVLWPGCEAKLVSASGDTAQKGELWVRNPGLMTGYHNLSAVTASRMRDGWLMTGDLFEVDADGFWYFCGRTDDMFVCGGENIFPKEVEDLLLTHPLVLEACVVPAEYAAKGEAPVALVVASPNLTVDEAGLKEFCIQHGPAYAHPRRIIFTDVLPLNGAGKVDRGRVAKELRNILSAAPSA